MAREEHFISDLLRDIAANVESAVRSKARLMAADLLNRVDKVKSAVPVLIAAGVVAVSAFFLIGTVIFALAVALPMLAAIAIIARYWTRWESRFAQA